MQSTAIQRQGRGPICAQVITNGDFSNKQSIEDNSEEELALSKNRQVQEILDKIDKVVFIRTVTLEKLCC